jgi:type II secretory pathway component PulK
LYTPAVKISLHNNPAFFSHFASGSDWAQVSYTLYDQGAPAEYFGVVDEERKLNLNTVQPLVLQRLIEIVAGLKPEDAKRLAESILDWRQWGESQAAGFFSDEYYANLEHPYKKKDADYEVLDELLLVKGMTRDIYERLLPYVTVYGDGKVNINTASGPVLYALGLNETVVEKILIARSGKDEVEGTSDDYFFPNAYDVAAGVAAFQKLEKQEARAIDGLNVQGLLTVNSYYFSGSIQARLSRLGWSKNARMVISARENKVLYWREK